jgi:hypothetical protein
VTGRYWITSNTSVRSTTDPGVTARFPPTSNFVTSTLAGRCGGRIMSRTKRLPPWTRFAAPASMITFSTAGFDQGKFVGASASSKLLAANRAWRSVRQSSRGIWILA